MGRGEDQGGRYASVATWMREGAATVVAAGLDRARREEPEVVADSALLPGDRARGPDRRRRAGGAARRRQPRDGQAARLCSSAPWRTAWRGTPGATWSWCVRRPP
ncbi:hypothetical protein [Nonomuraea dietziae]|uniref:hypothetical protein n=1 Tax=Nonomuraea dietziae TaxID=65515 RepID=UPI0031D27928